MGAVVFTVDASDDGPPWPAYCAAVGALLRLENHGPDGVSANPPEKVACTYEAAVRECRFLEPGTVRFTIERETNTRTLTVVVVN
jgi:hypothetical protein